MALAMVLSRMRRGDKLPSPSMTFLFLDVSNRHRIDKSVDFEASCGVEYSELAV